MHLKLVGRFSRQALLTGTAIVGLSCFADQAAAQQYLWNGSGTNYNQVNYWLPSTAVPSGSGQSALFNNNGNSTVSVTSGPIAPDSWTFDSGTQNYNVSGQAVNFNGAGPNLINQSGTNSISNNMTGAGIAVNGGQLTLSGTNAFSTAYVSVGATLSAGATGAFGSSIALSVFAGGSLDLAGYNQTIGSLDGSGVVSLGAASLTTGGSGASTTFSGPINGTGGSLIKVGGGDLTLSGSNSYTGGTTLNNGAVVISAGDNLGTGTVTFNGGTLRMNGNLDLSNDSNLTGFGTVEVGSVNTATMSGVISGTAAFVKSGNGTLILTAGNTYSGTTTVSAGVLNIQNAAGLGTDAGGTSVSAGAALQLQGGIFVSSEALTLNSTGTANNGALRNISGNNTFGGPITLGSSSRIQASAGLLTLSGGISGAGNALTLGGAGDITVSGAIATGSGSLTKDGTGTLILSGANSYAGTTTVFAGALNLRNAAGLGTDSGGTSVVAGAALQLQDHITVSSEALALNGTGVANDGALRSISGNNTYGGPIALGSSSRINADAGLLTVSGGISGAGNALTLGGAGNITVSGVIATGSGSLTKDGVGTATLSGANTYTGTTTVTGGTLQAGAVNVFGNGSNAMSVNSGSTLNLNDFNQTVGQLVGSAGALVTLGSATLTTGTSASTTYAGTISGTGGLTKVGGGTLTLSGANTYSGDTILSAGVLGLANDQALGSGTVQVSAVVSYGANVTIANTMNLTSSTAQFQVLSGTATQSGAISETLGSNPVGPKPIEKIGAGTLVLTGANTYTGQTTVTAGTLRAGAVNVFGNASGIIIAASATLDLNSFNQTIGSLSGAAGAFISLGSATLTTGSSNSTSYDGIISGTGGLTKTGSGTLTLNGSNTYSGATTVNGGTLRAGASNAFGSGGAMTVAAGTLDLNGFAHAVSSLAGAGAVSLGTARLTAGSGNTSTAFSGAISGTGGLTKTGTGMLILAGSNTYTNTTIVNAGTLSVNGSIASSSMTTVNAGGTLAGSGTVGNTSINGGMLAPGNSIGTLTVQGNLALTAASSYMVEVSPSAADRVNVTGTATLGGAAVNASFANGTYISKQYTILNATGGVTGTFGSQVNTNLPSNFTSSLSYDSNNAYLNLTLNFVPPTPPGPTPNPVAPTFPALNGNQWSLAQALIYYFNRNGGIPFVFGALTSAGLTQVAGETATGQQQTAFNAMTQFMGIITDPFSAGRVDAPSAIGFAETRSPTDAFASMHKKAPQMFAERWNVWAAGFGGSQTTDGNAVAGSSKTNSSLYGTAVGADYWFSPQTVAGFALAGGGSNFAVTGGGTGRSDLFQAGAFVRHTAGAAYLTAAIAYGWQDITTDRTVTVAGFDQLRARFNANTYSARVEGGNRTVMNGIGLTPYAAAQVAVFDLPAYAESVVAGANTFALSYGGQSVMATRSELGVRSDKSFAVQDAILTLRGRVAWAHDFNTDRATTATFQTLPGASFTVNGARLAPDAALTTASAEMKWMNGWSAAATFEGEFSDVTRSYAGKGVVRYAW